MSDRPECPDCNVLERSYALLHGTWTPVHYAFLEAGGGWPEIRFCKAIYDHERVRGADKLQSVRDILELALRDCDDLAMLRVAVRQAVDCIGGVSRFYGATERW